MPQPKKKNALPLVLLLVIASVFVVVGYFFWFRTSSWWIDRQVANVEKVISSYHHVRVRVPLGEVDIYRDGTSLVKVSARFFGEYARRRIDTRSADYYFINNTPVYLKERVMRLTSAGDEVTNIEDNRYYFANGNAWPKESKNLLYNGKNFQTCLPFGLRGPSLTPYLLPHFFRTRYL
ncbi:hypothetical protein HYV22_00025 [Candidatus Gottesmanbacteria bacterium]|nr:hypothetical protein [Candidatus Gottesmanbacteria bacterium]